MAETVQAPQELDSLEDIQQERSPLLGKVMIASFVGIVIAVECIFAYFWIPSKEQIARAARKQAGRLQSDLDSGVSTTSAKAAVPVIEVDLGTLSVSRPDPKSKIVLRIDYHPYATVHEEDEERFLKLYKQFKSRLGAKMNAELRKASYPDLTDPDLGLIKRRIKETSNALLGKPIIREIFFVDFSVIQL